MALGHLENFHFQKSPMLIWSASGFSALDETLTLGPYTAMVALNGTVSNAYCEPQQLQTSGNEGHRLDNLTRIILFISRSSGTAPTAVFSIGREGETPVAFPSIAIPLEGAESFVIYDGFLPRDFCKAAASPALDDEVFMSCDVTTGATGLSSYAALAIIVPGFVSGESDKGANLSAPKYLGR